MVDFTLKLCVDAFKSGIVPYAYVVASLNLLVQSLFNIAFGSKGIPKARGYRGE